jgi:hypothetical protein
MMGAGTGAVGVGGVVETTGVVGVAGAVAVVGVDEGAVGAGAVGAAPAAGVDEVADEPPDGDGVPAAAEPPTG